MNTIDYTGEVYLCLWWERLKLAILQIGFHLKRSNSKQFSMDCIFSSDANSQT